MPDHTWGNAFVCPLNLYRPEKSPHEELWFCRWAEHLRSEFKTEAELLDALSVRREELVRVGYQSQTHACFERRCLTITAIYTWEWKILPLSFCGSSWVLPGSVPFLAPTHLMPRGLFWSQPCLSITSGGDEVSDSLLLHWPAFGDSFVHHLAVSNQLHWASTPCFDDSVDLKMHVRIYHFNHLLSAQWH